MRKRISSIMLVLTLVVTAVIVPQTEAVAYAGEQPISVTINGERVVFADQNPVIVDGRTLVPVRGVFEHLGFEVGWAPDTRQALLTSDDFTVVITVGSATFTVNGANRILDVPAQIINDRTMLPIRAVVESVGYFVDWDATTRTVIIDTAGVWNFRMAGLNPYEFADSVVMRWAAGEIQQRTNGRVVIEHFPVGLIGDYFVGLEEIASGEIEMGVVVPPLRLDYRLGIKYIPWMITNYEDAKTLWQPGTNMFDMLHDIHYDNGFKMLGLLPGGMMGIGTIWPFTSDVWDFTVPSTDLLIRLPPFETLHIMADVMQLRITEIPFADLYPALSTGVVDGWIGGGVELNYALARDVINYYYDIRYYDDTFTILMNLDIYYALPAEFRAIISEVMLEATVRALDMREERDAYFKQRLRDYGITVLVPTDAERAQMAHQFRTLGWPRFVDMFGLDTMNALLEDVGLPPMTR